MRTTRSPIRLPLRGGRRRGVTLLELILAIGLLAVLTSLTFAALMRRAKSQYLEVSCRELASLITMVRARAQLDGKVYRVRFLTEEEVRDAESDAEDGGPTIDPRQPVIEREDDPIEEPGKFTRVKAPWARRDPFLGDVWCCEVRLGKPTIDQLIVLRESRAEDLKNDLEEAFDEFDPRFPPLIIYPSGQSEWVTFVLTEAEYMLDLENLRDEVRIDTIIDGFTGEAWLQRPFYDEELDLFAEKHWPAVLRQDLLTSYVLTEDDVLEIQERRLLRGAGGDKIDRVDRIDDSELRQIREERERDNGDGAS